MSKRELKTQKDLEPELAGDSERPPIRELLKKLIAEDPNAVRKSARPPVTTRLLILGTLEVGEMLIFEDRSEGDLPENF